MNIKYLIKYILNICTNKTVYCYNKCMFKKKKECPFFNYNDKIISNSVKRIK
jgi:hypothetical protein